ncbi:hypothetical protein PVAP13_2KG584200 [Panicum virgatum]|nr:hypothetical protein PVAP13_2KG584200 [Panicum virgatum]
MHPPGEKKTRRRRGTMIDPVKKSNGRQSLQIRPVGTVLLSKNDKEDFLRASQTDNVVTGDRDSIFTGPPSTDSILLLHLPATYSDPSVVIVMI